GKKMLAFPDVRTRPPKWYGQNFDPGGFDHKTVGRMLQITGRDRISIVRKYNPIPWEGTLFGKIWIASNRIPNFNDPVLPTRFVKVAFNVSFLDREDHGLADRLKATELPGIAARCLRAYWRLKARGRFIQPRGAERLEREIREGSDPFARFAHETFVPDQNE